MRFDTRRAKIARGKKLVWRLVYGVLEESESFNEYGGNE